MHGNSCGEAAEGATEVWSYNSGNNQTAAASFGTSNTNASLSGNSNYASGQASTTGTGQAFTTSTGIGIARSRYCTVNVTMVHGSVSRVNYVGPTGGLLTQGEQCAYAVENCLK
jgi:hypothetical protein